MSDTIEINSDEGGIKVEPTDNSTYTEYDSPPIKRTRLEYEDYSAIQPQTSEIKMENQQIVTEIAAEEEEEVVKTVKIKTARGRHQIIAQSEGEIEGIDALFDLKEITPFNISHYIGNLNTPEEPYRTMCFLSRYGIIQNSWECRHCANLMSLVQDVSIADRFLWRCNACRFPGNALRGKLSIRHQSWLSESKLKMGVILRLAAHWAQFPNTPFNSVAHEYGISVSAVADYYNFFRDACQNWFHRNAVHTKVGGPGKIVEIEESKYFVQSYSRGVKRQNRPFELILVAVDKETEYMAYIPIKERTLEELIPLLRQYIAPGSIIVNCDWDSYGGLPAVRNAYLPYDHDATFIKWDDPKIMCAENLTAMAFRDKIRKVQGYNDKMPTYIYQYLFRRVNTNMKMFQSLMYELQLMYKPSEDRVGFI